ncbi:MAG: M20 family metallopeptidase [Sedimentisphaerales bacterium]|nr:M20 family metallopeptidase [Sedimentisphaerales bacterium]
MNDFLSRLIQAESTVQTGERNAAKVVSDEFARSGIQARIDVWNDNRANVSARITSIGPRPALLFACHLDVVGPGDAAWKNPPFSGIRLDGRILGRGATDMKGGVAAAVTAIRRIVDSNVKLLGDIVFLAAAGEETDSSGAERFVAARDELPRFAGVIIPEPTDFEIITAHRGMLWLEITTKGTAAHSSTPHLGVNAITAAKSVIDELQHYKPNIARHDLLGDCSMSINTIAGGKALNVVPDSCKIGVDFRTLPGQDHADILADLRKIIERLKSADPNFDAQIAIVRQVGPLETDCHGDFVRDFCSTAGIAETKAVGFTTDGPCFAELGAPVVIFGPGKPEICHKPDEYIEIADLERAVEYYRKVILKFLT